MDSKEIKNDVYTRLNEGVEERIEERMTRPLVEMWVDEDSAWVAYHEGRENDKRFTHFGVGHH